MNRFNKEITVNSPRTTQLPSLMRPQMDAPYVADELPNVHTARTYCVFNPFLAAKPSKVAQSGQGRCNGQP
ncbi:hypothetical protein V1289_007450 [Bradyrhizobium sp. AZCC 2289]